VRESIIERAFREAVEARGGHCLKLRFLNRIGAPDRLVLLKRRHFLVELKATKKGATAIQKRVHALLRWAGFRVEVINDINQIEGVLK
jgi:hypothetical protein